MRREGNGDLTSLLPSLAEWLPVKNVSFLRGCEKQNSRRAETVQVAARTAAGA